MSADKEESARIALERYKRNAPSARGLDEIERARKAGKIGVVRQVAPGVYSWTDGSGLVMTR